MVQLRKSILDAPIEMNFNDPKAMASLMNPNATAVCLHCGITVCDADKHYKEKTHYLFIKSSNLMCKQCGHTFKPSELNERVANMLMKIGAAIMEKLPKLMEAMTKGMGAR